MPAIPGICGLQSVSIDEGECHYISSMTGESHIYRTTPAIAAKLDTWLKGGGLCIQDVVPELPADDRELMLTGLDSEGWDDTYGDV